MRYFAVLLAACTLSLGAAASQSSGAGAGRIVVSPTPTAPVPKPVIVSPTCGSKCLNLAGGAPPTVVDRPIKPGGSSVQLQPTLVAPNCSSGCGPRSGGGSTQVREFAGGEPPIVVDFGTGRRG